jgi:surface carbohydrate biosynthesis protein
MIKGLVKMSCEVGRRELMARATLAGALASQGIASIIGHKTLFPRYPGVLPRGVFFYKSVTKVCGSHYDRAKKEGDVTVGICEELWNHHSPTTYFSADEQIYPPTVNGLDFFIASNEYDLSIANQAKAQSIIPLGNFRYFYAENAAIKIYSDLVDSLRSLSRKRVLVLAPGGVIFAVRNLANELRHYNALGHSRNSTAVIELVQGWITRDMEVLHELKSVSNMCFDELIVRPHPHDDPSLYSQLFGSGRKVSVTADYDFHPWALASENVIHFNSTALVEMNLLKVKSTNLARRPDPYLVGESFFVERGFEGVERFFFAKNMFRNYLDFFLDVSRNRTEFTVSYFEELLRLICKAELRLHPPGWDDPRRFDESMLHRWRLTGEHVARALQKAAQFGFGCMANKGSVQLTSLGPMGFAVHPKG